MSGKRELIEFVIQDSYTPASMPMARLAEYLADLAALLGERDRVHFVDLCEGSARIRHVVEHEAAPKVRARVSGAGTGAGDADALSAFARLNARLRDDNATAVLRSGDDDGAQLLFFPGARTAASLEYGPFLEQGQLHGVPITVGGKGALANVNLEDGGEVYYCGASRELAVQIAPLLYTTPIRVYGTGTHLRNRDGRWVMKSFRISHFETLDARPLGETVERLRAVTRRVGLKKDVISALADLREG